MKLDVKGYAMDRASCMFVSMVPYDKVDSLSNDAGTSLMRFKWLLIAIYYEEHHERGRTS